MEQQTDESPCSVSLRPLPSISSLSIAVSFTHGPFSGDNRAGTLKAWHALFIGSHLSLKNPKTPDLLTTCSFCVLQSPDASDPCESKDSQRKPGQAFR